MLKNELDILFSIMTKVGFKNACLYLISFYVSSISLFKPRWWLQKQAVVLMTACDPLITGSLIPRLGTEGTPADLCFKVRFCAGQWLEVRNCLRFLQSATIILATWLQLDCSKLWLSAAFIGWKNSCYVWGFVFSVLSLIFLKYSLKLFMG